jgi:hypothetical protein
LKAILHPEDYFMPGQPLDRIFLNRMLVYAVGKKLLMNEECGLSRAKKWGMDLSSSSVIEMPI